MFSFFSRGNSAKKKKVDCNSNNESDSNQNHTSLSLLTPLLHVTTSLVPRASPSAGQSAVVNAPFATQTHHAADDADASQVIGNGIAKMCKNKTLEASNNVSKTSPTSVAVAATSAPSTSCESAPSPTSSPPTTRKLTSSPQFAPRHHNGEVLSENATKMSFVKPAGHGTLAISARIPTPNASRRNSAVTPTPTPPESPRIVEIFEDCNGFPMGNGHHLTAGPEAPPRIRKHDESTTDTKKNLVNQEAKFQCQLNDLAKQLAARDAEANKLRFQMEELQRDVFAKSAGMDRLQAELQAAHKESEYVKQRIRNLEQDLRDYREKNGHLAEEIARKTENLTESESSASTKINDLERVIRELRERIARLEAQITDLQAEKQALVAQHASILQERDNEKHQVEHQLEEAIKQKDAVAAKWQTEFEKLRTLNLLKEQSTLDDFEWQLREVHKTCKTRLDEKERSLDQRLKEAYRDAELRMTIAQEMMNEVQHLKQCKNEVSTLKSSAEEQRQTMQEMRNRQEAMKDTEHSLKDEARKLRSLIDLEKENLQHMQRMHHQELVDKERWLQTTLQEKKTEIAEYWEERLLHEIGRLKWELEQLYLEEKQLAIKELKSRKEVEFDDAKAKWERKIAECLKDIKDLKSTLDVKEAYYQKELAQQQTHSDREIFEVRRIMDKIDNAHHERFEKLVLDHELELEKLTMQHDARLAEMEQSYKNQTSTLRASLILLKDQMEREAQQQINELIAQHRSQLDTQWANLVHQKSAAIKLLEQDYVLKIKTLEEQFYTQQKSHEAREVELLKTIDSLKNEVESKESTIDDMQSNVDTLEGGVQVLNQEIAQQSEQLMRNRRDADQKIRGLQDVLIKLQALADQERDECQAQHAQQQKQSMQQVEHLQKKVTTLTKLFEEVRSRYERRESRQEDLNTIADLRQVIAEQEKDLTCINEEKRYYQMQLMSMQREDDESYEDADDVDAPEPSDYTVTFPADADECKMPARPKLTACANLAIPPTIPECDDCDEDSS